jgi:hypothetical protein
MVGTLTENILPDWVEAAVAKNTMYQDPGQ